MIASIEPLATSTRSVLTGEYLDPLATVEFIPRRDGIFCGCRAVMDFLNALGGHRFQVWALDEGAEMHAGEVALRVRGHFLEYGTSIHSLAALLATQSAWATKAYVLVASSSPLPAILTTSHLVLPEAVARFEYAAQVGGCAPKDSSWSSGVLSPTLSLLLGDSLRALKALDTSITADVPRLVSVESFEGASDEAVRLALGVGDHLAGVIVEAPEDPTELPTRFLNEMRSHLDLAGFPRVKVFVGGKVTNEQIEVWMREQAPVNGFLVGDAIADTAPLPFAAELKESDGKPLARRGLTPGTSPGPRLKPRDVE